MKKLLKISKKKKMKKLLKISRKKKMKNKSYKNNNLILLKLLKII